MISAYFKFICLPDEVMALNRIRSKERLDCILYANMDVEEYKGLTDFVNGKGQMFLYKTPARDIVTSHSRRLTEWALNNGNLNLSSIYIEDFEFPEFGYGYPNGNRLLRDGSANPLFPYSNDGYIFIMNKDYSQIELLIIPDGRNLISSYYQKMIDGGFESEIIKLREQAKPFFRYEGLVI